MKTIDLTIDQDKVSTKINPNIFGHFIEFMFDCIDGGLSAQMLVSRGFENPDRNQDGVSEPWEPTGFNDAFEYALDQSVALAPFQSQRIRIFNHFNGYRGIAQSGMRMEQKRHYHGSVWMKSEGCAVVDILLTCADGTNVFTKRVCVESSKWEKTEFEFLSDQADEDTTFEIRLLSQATLWLDQASLIPADSRNGVWASVMDRIKALHPSTLRFPGGCFADCYHWQDGCGEADFRPARENAHWGGVEENNFGTDEFLLLCRSIGCEPIICVNFGSGTPEEAAQWVEYCNGSSETEYGSIRARNGNKEPFHVKYWEFGNEIFGDWEIGHCSADEYADKYRRFYKAMKEKDETIECIACAGNGNSMDQAWNERLLALIGDKINILALHTYAPMIENAELDNRDLYKAVAGAPAKYEAVIQKTLDTIRNVCGGTCSIKLGITEWNTSYHNKSGREQTLEAAIFNAGMMNMFLRNSDEIIMCNASDLVNGWSGGLIRSKKGVTFGTPSYYAVMMYSQTKAAERIQSYYECETYQTKHIGNVDAMDRVPYVDIVVCRNAEGKKVVFTVNRYEDSCVKLTISGVRNSKTCTIMSLWSEELSDVNSVQCERVVPRRTQCDMNEIVLPPHSISTIQF